MCHCQIRRQAQLRREIGKFLGSLDAVKIAEEVLGGNPAVHGWLLMRIHNDVEEYRADLDQIHGKLAEIGKSIQRYGSVPEPMESELLIAVFGRDDTLRVKFSRKFLDMTPEDRNDVLKFLGLTPPSMFAHGDDVRSGLYADYTSVDYHYDLRNVMAVARMNDYPNPISSPTKIA